MNVATLLYNNYQVGNLVLDTIRVGFPTAKLWVAANRNVCDSVITKCKKLDAFMSFTNCRTHHDFIQDWVHGPSDPLFIIDPDIIFWESMEDLTSIRTGFFRGVFTPEHLTDYGEFHTVSRFHSSFLYFPDPCAVARAIKEVFPPSQVNPSCVPFNPFAPQTVFQNGRPLFFDTCANLFHAIGGEELRADYSSRFTHIGHGSSLELMCKHVPATRAARLREIHRLAIHDPVTIKYLWKEQRDYYELRRQALCLKYQTASQH